jgi:peptide deformylase
MGRYLVQIATIVKAGDPLLKQIAQPVTEFNTQALTDLIDFLFKNLRHYNGAGISAPQCGIGQSIFVYGFTHNPRYPEQDPIADSVVINPEITYYSDEKNAYYEGCLSLPHLRGLVERSEKIRYTTFTPQGIIIEKEACGFEARIIQHETDHLQGLLFPMRIRDISTLQYSEK